jgi:hypothetical protein
MEQKDIKNGIFADQLRQYENKWVGLQDEKVIASGNSPEEVKKQADRSGIQRFSFYLVPPFNVSFIPSLWG